MTFLLLRREGAPMVSFVTHYRAGAVDEWTGISGTAHLFEHMLFKGSTVIGTNNLAAEQGLFPAIDAAAIRSRRSSAAAPRPTRRRCNGSATG